jgi:hypothetical protein
MNRGVADDEDPQAASVGHLVHFPLHRTGICIYIDI